MRAYIERTLARLVATPSVNPFFDPASAGERAAAELVANEMRSIGCEVRILGVARASVIATLRGEGRGRSLMLNGHLDTVGVEGMEDPFSGRIDGTRLYGRGAYDMKGSIVAAMAAMRELAAERPPGDVVLAAVADEEYASAGTEEALGIVRTDGGICLEPTSLRTVCAHKGFVWIEARMRGLAAHGSRFELGVDANLKMGQFLARLADLEQQLRARAPHPLVGPPSLHAAMLSGGSGWSTYAAESTVQIERRTVPGETAELALAEIRALAPDDARLIYWRDAFEVAADAAIVRTLREAGGGEIAGDTPWMDASLMAAAGIETVIFGPHGEGAHAAVEWVDLDSVERCAQVLIEAARRYTRLPR
jgi:acetylornithine deacetylase